MAHSSHSLLLLQGLEGTASVIFCRDCGAYGTSHPVRLKNKCSPYGDLPERAQDRCRAKRMLRGMHPRDNFFYPKITRVRIPSRAEGCDVGEVPFVWPSLRDDRHWQVAEREPAGTVAGVGEQGTSDCTAKAGAAVPLRASEYEFEALTLDEQIGFFGLTEEGPEFG